MHWSRRSRIVPANSWLPFSMIPISCPFQIKTIFNNVRASYQNSPSSKYQDQCYDMIFKIPKRFEFLYNAAEGTIQVGKNQICWEKQNDFWFLRIHSKTWSGIFPVTVWWNKTLGQNKSWCFLFWFWIIWHTRICMIIFIGHVFPILGESWRLQ